MQLEREVLQQLHLLRQCSTTAVANACCMLEAEGSNPACR